MSAGTPRPGEADIPFRFRTTVDIRFRDVDALGHVNNAVYFTYFEIARSAYFAAVQGRRLSVDDFRIVVAEASCRYRSPAFYGERLIVDVATTSLRSRSFELRYRITGDGRLVAEGRTVLVAYDHRARRTTTLTPAFRRQIEHFEGRTIGERELGRH
jgi:acyl-CoA thioester hydrolase